MGNAKGDINKPHSYQGDVKDPSKVTEELEKTGDVIDDKSGTGSCLIPDSSSDLSKPWGGGERGDGNIEPNPYDPGLKNKAFKDVED